MTKDHKALAAIVNDQICHIDAARLRGASQNEIAVAMRIVDRTAAKLATYLETNNSNFSREAFLKACGVY